MGNTILEIRGLRKVFDPDSHKQLVAIDNLDLSVERNEFVCIVGPSGCGKSTLLRIVAGLDFPDQGSVVFNNHKITGPAKERGMVFQEYSLMPWRNVQENIWMGAEFEGVSHEKRKALADDYIKLIQLEGFEKAYPHELSGGMRQRVAIARALANDPDVLLMDEPFGALDSHTRILLQKELLKIWQTHRKTILFITHSVDEAVYLADRIVVMSPRPGRIILEECVDIPHPRRRDNPAYSKILEAVLELLDPVNQ